jgi:hypothetical protein
MNQVIKTTTHKKMKRTDLEKKSENIQEEMVSLKEESPMTR